MANITIGNKSFTGVNKIEVPITGSTAKQTFIDISLAGADTSDATATASDILASKTAYVKGTKITGNIPTKTSSNVTASGPTVTIPSGYYATEVTKSIGAGSATTPATTITANPTLSNTYTSGSGYKMSVSSSKSVTPTVTTGYVAAGTAGTITVSGSAYVTQSTIGSETTSTTAAATKTVGYGKQVTVSSGYYPSDRIIRNSVGSATVSVAGTVTLSGSVTPGAVTLASNSTNVGSGKTRIASTPTTSTSSLPSYYIAVKPSVAAGSGTITASGTATANPTTAGYFSTATSASISTSGTINSTAKAGSVYYLPIATETKTATPSTAAQDITPSSGKLLSKVTVNAIATETKTVTPSTATQNITPSSGKLLSKVTVNAMPVGSATVQLDDMLECEPVMYLVEQSDVIAAHYNDEVTITPTVTAGYISQGTPGTIEIVSSNSYQLPEYYLARSARTEVANQAQQISDIISLLETKLTNDPALVERDYLVLNIDYSYAPDGTVKLSWNRCTGANTYSIAVVNSGYLELARDITGLAYVLTEGDIHKIGELNQVVSGTGQAMLVVSAFDANGNEITESFGAYIGQHHLAPKITYDGLGRAKLTISGITSFDKLRGCRCYYTKKNAISGVITQYTTTTDTSYITCGLGDQITAWIFQPGYLNSPTAHYLHDPNAPV